MQDCGNVIEFSFANLILVKRPDYCRQQFFNASNKHEITSSCLISFARNSIRILNYCNCNSYQLLYKQKISNAAPRRRYALIQSYPINSKFFCGAISTSHAQKYVDCGMPQGSCSGLLMFIGHFEKPSLG